MMIGKCAKCKAAIRWAISAKNAAMPIDAEPVANGNLVLEERDGKLYARVLKKGATTTQPRYQSHFASCPFAASFRRPKPGVRPR